MRLRGSDSINNDDIDGNNDLDMDKNLHELESKLVSFLYTNRRWELHVRN